MNNTKLAQILGLAIPRKSSLQVLYNFAIKDKIAYATDLAFDIVVNGVDAEDGLYSYKLFKNAGFKAAKQDYGIEEYPEIEYFKKFDKLVPFNPQSVIEATKVVQFVSGDYSTRISLTGVSFRKDEVNATNGHYLGLVSTDVGADVEFILPESTVNAVKTITKTHKLRACELHYEKDDAAYVKMAFQGDEWVELGCKVVEGPYPNYRSVFPDVKENVLSRGVFTKENTLKLIDSIERLNKVTNPKTKQLFIQGGIIYTKNPNAGKIFSAGKVDLPDISFCGSYALEVLDFIGEEFEIVVKSKLSAIMFTAGDKTVVLMPLRLMTDDGGEIDVSEAIEI